MYQGCWYLVEEANTFRINLPCVLIHPFLSTGDNLVEWDNLRRLLDNIPVCCPSHYWWANQPDHLEVEADGLNRKAILNFEPHHQFIRHRNRVTVHSRTCLQKNTIWETERQMASYIWPLICPKKTQTAYKRQNNERKNICQNLRFQILRNQFKTLFANSNLRTIRPNIL